MTDPPDSEGRITFENAVRGGTELAEQIVRDVKLRPGSVATGHIGITYTLQDSLRGRRLVTNAGTVLAGPGKDATADDFMELSHAHGTVMRQLRRAAKHPAGPPERSL